MDASGPRRYPGLDGLRGIAILLVIPCNANIVVPVVRGPFIFFTLLIDRGWVGVQLFFVLSGFLITEQLYSSRTATNYFSGFYARRALRILPLFFAAVVLGLVLTRVWGGRGYFVTPAWMLWFGLLFINWIQPLGHGLPGCPQFWSLAVEEQFYLAWPAVVRTFASRLMRVAAGLALLSLVLRILMLSTGASPDMAYMWTICRMDALAFGAMGALIVRGWRTRNVVPRPLPWVASALVAAVIGGSVTHLYASDSVPTQTVGYTCLGIAFTLILLATVANDLSPRHAHLLAVLRSRALASVGRYSYGMYAFHMFFVIFAAARIKSVAVRFGDARMLACSLIVIALAYAAGFLSYHLYEKHFLRLGRLFAPRGKTDILGIP
jgi:peptidoglycan/LPS O-acetylase OafA/YrhL